jgi:hypothetical protein
MFSLLLVVRGEGLLGHLLAAKAANLEGEWSKDTCTLLLDRGMLIYFDQ